MNKLIIVIFVVLASYLVYNNLDQDKSEEATNENNISKTINNETGFQIQQKTGTGKSVDKERIMYEIDSSNEPETKSFEKSLISGTYIADVNNEQMTANVQYSFFEDGTFVDQRIMSKPKVLSGSVSGTYKIEGARLTLFYPENRDLNVYRFKELIMSLHKDETIRSGVLTFIKS